MEVSATEARRSGSYGVRPQGFGRTKVGVPAVVAAADGVLEAAQAGRHVARPAQVHHEVPPRVPQVPLPLVVLLVRLLHLHPDGGLAGAALPEEHIRRLCAPPAGFRVQGLGGLGTSSLRTPGGRSPESRDDVVPLSHLNGSVLASTRVCDASDLTVAGRLQPLHQDELRVRLWGGYVEFAWKRRV